MSSTYRQMYQRLRQELHGRENGENESRWLLEAFGGEKFFHLDLDADIADISRYEQALASLKRGEPFQYVIGETEFFGHRIVVNGDVLIPRPETELLVAAALAWGEGKDLRALDICTGSGCIAVALAKALKGSFFAIDISDAALAVAAANGERNGVEITFHRGDLFAALPAGDSFDLITANPPYLTAAEMGRIPPEVTFEPSLALDGGAEGLDVIDGLLKDVTRHLNDGGLFLMEIGETQGEAVLTLAKRYGLGGGRLVKDLNGKDRFFRYEKS